MRSTGSDLAELEDPAELEKAQLALLGVVHPGALEPGARALAGLLAQARVHARERPRRCRAVVPW